MEAILADCLTNVRQIAPETYQDKQHIMQNLLAVMTNNGWQAGINDPGFTGWITVGCYFLTSVLCFRQLWRLKAHRRQAIRQPAIILWSGLSLLFCALGVSKQLDLLSLLTGLGRSWAYTQGWYDQRRTVQVVFIALMALAFVSSVKMIVTHFPRTSRRHRLALLGAVFLTSLIITRAASFHHLDTLLHWHLGSMTVNWILELGGISLVAIAAGWNVRWRFAEPIMANCGIR